MTHTGIALSGGRWPAATHESAHGHSHPWAPSKGCQEGNPPVLLAIPAGLANVDNAAASSASRPLVIC